MQHDQSDDPPAEVVTGYIKTEIYSADGAILGTLAGFVELGGAVGGVKGGSCFAVERNSPSTPEGSFEEGSGEKLLVEDIEKFSKDEIAGRLRQRGITPDVSAGKDSLVDQLAVALRAGRSRLGAQVDAVWSAYVAAMKPRRTAAGEAERRIIRAALKEATVDECVTCIKACAASDYHMKRGEHAKRKGGKYNSLGKILKPRPRNGETQRSRIDWWLDKEISTGVAGFPSADPAIVRQHQLEVQRGHGSDDTDAVRKAKDAEAWLAKHGIETTRRESDGYPIFKRVDAHGGGE
jgi:hypothetical protein